MWQDLAFCKDADTEIFFPKGVLVSRGHVAQVKKDYCDKCIVRPACYREAKENDIGYGIWGGYHFLEDNPAKA